MDVLIRESLVSTVGYMFEALNGGEYDEFLSYFDEDLVFIHAAGKSDKQRLTQFYSRIDSIFQNHHHEVERILVDDNTVVVDCIWTGKHIGPYQGIEPSNSYYEIPVVWLFDFEDGKVLYAKRLVDNHIFNMLAE